MAYFWSQNRDAMNIAEFEESILEHPHAPLILQRVQRTLDAERLLRQHFYETVREDEKAEFINGEIIVHSPVKKRHNTMSGWLYQLINVLAIKKDLGYVGHEKLMVALTRNDYEPDICFFEREKAAAFKEDQTIFPAPDFVVEVLSRGTATRDRGIKFEDYQAHGVREYWLVAPTTHTIEQYVLDDTGEFVLTKTAGKNDSIRSAVIAGFEIPVRAIFDEQVFLKTLAELVKD